MHYLSNNGLKTTLLVHWNENIMKYTPDFLGWNSDTNISRSLFEHYTDHKLKCLLYPPRGQPQVTGQAIMNSLKGGRRLKSRGKSKSKK